MAVFVQGVFVTLSPFTPLCVEYTGDIRLRFALQIPDFIFNGECFVESAIYFFSDKRMSRYITVCDKFAILNIVLVFITYTII